MKIKTILQIFIAIIVGLIVASVFSHFVPYNMDEFSLYHSLACEYYPNNSLNTYRVGCDQFDLNFLGTGKTIPLREYEYMGSITSLYYSPLFLIWPSPVSARFMGIIFLILEALVLAKIFRFRFWYIFAGLLLLFPYFFQHIVDTGVVGLQSLAVILIYYLSKKWFETRHTKYPLLIAISIFAGIWAKLTFFWLLPGIAIMFVALYWQNKNVFNENWKLFAKQAIFAAIVFLALYIPVFFSITSEGKFYARELLASQYSRPRSLIDLLKNFHPKIFWNSRVVQSLLNPLEASQRIYQVKNLLPLSFLYSALIYLTPLSLLIFLKKKLPTRYYLPALLYCSFLVTAFIVFMTPGAWSVHHAILSFPFLILAFLATLKESGPLQKKHQSLTSAGLIFIALNVYFFATFTKQLVYPYADSSIETTNKILNNAALADKYIYVSLDWGTYYLQSLYGPKNQTALYIDPLVDQNQVEELKKIKTVTGKKLLFTLIKDRGVAKNSLQTISDFGLIESNFKLQECSQVPPKSTWTIMLEAGNGTDICLR